MRRALRLFNFKWRAFLFAFILSLASEAFELIRIIINPYITGVLISIPFFLIGAAIENYYSKQDFKDNILTAISSIKDIKVRYNLNPDSIQEIMALFTNQLASALNRSEIKDEHTAEVSRQQRFQCKICSKEHETDQNWRCNKCRLSYDYWTYINQDIN